jgi:hypothetical protein
LVLPKALDQDLALLQHNNARCFQRASGGDSVLKQEMCHTLAINGERAAAFDTDARLAESVAHVSEGSGPVFE